MSGKLSIGDIVAGRYNLLDILGVSPTRTAFRAFDSEVEVEVALWVMQPKLFPTAAARSSFVSSANKARDVRHRHLLRVFEAGTVSKGGFESLYLTLQLGTSAELEGRLSAGGKADSSTILRYARSLATALDAMHDAGLYHGWLTPADVVEVAGQIKLCGAGVFETLPGPLGLANWGAHVRYLAPELIASGKCSAASDWYALGVILLELAIGEPAMSVKEALASLALRDPRQAEALALALAPNPQNRLASALSMVAAVKLAWEDSMAATGHHKKPVNLPVPALSSDNSPTLSMGQAFIDKAVAERIAAHRAETSLMVSEVDERALKSGLPRPEVNEPDESAGAVFDADDTAPKTKAISDDFDDGVTPQRVPTPPTPPTPPGGFDEGVTNAVVDTPPGGFEDGATVITMGRDDDGFDEGDTSQRTDAPPGGFDEGETSQRIDAPSGGFDEGPTSYNAKVPQSGFDEGVTVHKAVQPPAGGFDEGVTAHVAATPPESFAQGKTMDTPRSPSSGFDEGDTVDKAVPESFNEEATMAADGPIQGFPEYEMTLSEGRDPEESVATIPEDTPPPGGFEEGETIIDMAPGPRLLALSMKPKPDPGARTTKRKPYVATVAKPVLRPLSSLAEVVEVSPDLGTLAPPKREQPSSSPRRFWLGLSLVLVAGAAAVTVVLMLTRTPVSEGVVEPAEAVMSDAAVRPSPVREVLLLGPTCPDGTVHLSELNLCVDAYEAPGKGRQPQSGIGHADARDLCSARSMRLCTASEWESACQGAEGRRWPYGARYKPEICNLKGKKIIASGSHPDCRSSFAIYDMSGNIAEWTSEGEIRGGSAIDGSRGSCSELRTNESKQTAFSDVGFRCCADAIASSPPSD